MESSIKLEKNEPSTSQAPKGVDVDSSISVKKEEADSKPEESETEKKVERDPLVDLFYSEVSFSTFLIEKLWL